jgi:glycosyltransferase involved in cell wall biosynthesis
VNGTAIPLPVHTRVLLLHSGSIPHYRVAVYGYLSRYLRRHGYELIVASPAIQKGNPHPVEFDYRELELSALSIGRLIRRERTQIVILFVDMRHLYLFPTYFVAKLLLRQKMVWWGQGRDLAHPHAHLKNLAYSAEHAMCDAIILYAEHLKKYVRSRFHRKLFVANNTLVLDPAPDCATDRSAILASFGIRTRRNIVCVGRLQRRKRLDHLIAAHARMNRPDIGLVLAGPDTEGVLEGVDGPNVYKLGPLYGSRKLELLSACDVYCLPGAVGLSIVDAFHCGLPMVTESGDESAEIMYLRDGENGFVVPPGDIDALADRLLLLLDDDALRDRFSTAARHEIATRGRIEGLCDGFRDALDFARSADSRVASLT